MNILTQKWTYYNEFDPSAAAWIRELIKMKLISEGEVDERSIIDVQANDIRKFRRHNFFAGIAGWEYALRLAGWPDDRPVCTASLPCQSFSIAGSGKGKHDERHLLPCFIELVKECRFPVIFGEQVENAISHGWADDLVNELNDLNYETALQIIPAAATGAFHIRSRLWWVAKGGSNDITRTNEFSNPADNKHGNIANIHVEVDCEDNAERPSYPKNIGAGGETRSPVDGCGMDDPEGQRRPICDTAHFGAADAQIDASANAGDCFDEQPCGLRTADVGGMGDTEHKQHQRVIFRHREEHGQDTGRAAGESTRPMQAGGMGHAELHGRDANALGCGAGTGETESGMFKPERPDTEWLYCRDGKHRPIKRGLNPVIGPVKSGSCALAHGLPAGMVLGGGGGLPVNADETQEARVMRLRGYGNAICVPVAVEFISAFMGVNF